MSFLKSKKIAILLIAIFGFLVSCKLFHIYYQTNYNPYALASFCSINEIIDCDGIERSHLSQVFGIPFACWGMFLYSLIILFLFVDKLKNFKLLKFLEVFKNPKSYIATLGYTAFILSLVLAVTAFIQIQKICLLCVVTYIVDITIALIATDFNDGGIIEAFKTSVNDLLDGIKIPKYGISFGICVLIFISFLYYTTSSFVFTPHLILKRDINHYKKLIKNNPYKVSGNILGDENAKVTIELFTDYECPICRITNIMINRAAKEVKGIRIEHINFPLDNKCNNYLQDEFHQNSCLYAKYAIAAEKQEKWGIMNDLLFTYQPKNEGEIISLVENLPFDINKLTQDANSKETEAKLQEDISKGINYKLEGTPSIVINGQNYPGIKTYKTLKKMFKDARDGKEIKLDE